MGLTSWPGWSGGFGRRMSRAGCWVGTQLPRAGMLSDSRFPLAAFFQLFFPQAASQLAGLLGRSNRQHLCSDGF